MCVADVAKYYIFLLCNFVFSSSLSPPPLFHFFSYKLYFLAATAATAATWRHYAIGAATLAATKIDELATKIWVLDVVNRVIKPFVECCQYKTSGNISAATFQRVFEFMGRRQE